MIKPAFPNQKPGTLFGSDLGAEEREALIARMRARPHAFVAQEHLAFSQAPVWYTKNSDGFSARALGIRVYAIATPQGYRVMPGGLARFASDAHAEIVSMQRGGGSKDIWVLSDSDEASEEATAPIAAPDRAQRQAHDLPSTLVENLFWMGRYAERCDYKDAAAAGDARPAAQSAVLVAGDGDLQALRRRLGFRRREAFHAERRHRSPGRVRGSGARQPLRGELARAHGAARDFGARRRAAPRGARRSTACCCPWSALAGFALDDMTQDDGWRLMMIGRRLERLLFLCRCDCPALGPARDAAAPGTRMAARDRR